MRTVLVYPEPDRQPVTTIMVSLGLMSSFSQDLSIAAWMRLSMSSDQSARRVAGTHHTNSL